MDNEADKPILSILIVEGGSRGLARALLASRPGFALTHAERMSKAAALAVPARAAGGFDALVVDLSLPDCEGPEVCRRAVAIEPSAPVIALLRGADPEACEAALEAGAHACLEREGLDGGALASALRQSVWRRRAEGRRMRALLEAVPMGVLFMAGRRVLASNSAARELLGHDEASLAAISALDPFPPAARPIIERALDAREPSPARFSADLVRRDGAQARCRVHVAEAVLNDAPVAAVFLEPAGPSSDRSGPIGPADPERQALKMEAVGRLADGLTHDLNNLLAVVTGYSDHLLAQGGAGGPVSAGLKAIRRAGLAAADLARGLAGVIGGGEGEPEPVEIDRELRSLEPVMRRVLGDGIGLRMDLGARGLKARLEPGQLERALGNLCANAREAMPGGGVVTVSTRPAEAGAAEGFTHLAPAPGPGVSISVEDTGLGMDAHVRERLFEPFFTTKRGGRGLGMGLAAVYGMVSRARGGLAVESAPGAGSRFRLVLPREGEPAAVGAASGEAAPARTEGGLGAVLVVEDESYLREMIETILARAGFAVSGASTPGEAEAMLATGAADVELVVTDVMLPGETGQELAARLQAMRPGLRVLFMSGHSRESLAERGIDVPAEAFLEKPFTPARLAARAQALLEAARPRRFPSP